MTELTRPKCLDVRARYLNKRWGYKKVVRPLARLAMFWATPSCVYLFTGPLAKSSDQVIVLTGSAIEHILIGIWMCLFIFYLTKFAITSLRRISDKESLVLVFGLALPMICIYLIHASLPTAITMTAPILLLTYLWLRRKRTANSLKQAYGKYLDMRLNTANINIPISMPRPVKKSWR